MSASFASICLGICTVYFFQYNPDMADRIHLSKHKATCTMFLQKKPTIQKWSHLLWYTLLCTSSQSLFPTCLLPSPPLPSLCSNHANLLPLLQYTNFSHSRDFHYMCFLVLAHFPSRYPLIFHFSLHIFMCPLPASMYSEHQIHPTASIMNT